MSQIFQSSYPKKDFFEFLDIFCEKKDKQYLFSKESFKRIKLEEQAQPFCDNLKKYYSKSKNKFQNTNFCISGKW